MILSCTKYCKDIEDEAGECKSGTDISSKFWSIRRNVPDGKAGKRHTEQHHLTKHRMSNKIDNERCL